MQKIDALKLQLCDAIKESEEYKEYRRMQEIMDRSPDLKRQVDEFRRQNFEIQMSETEDVFGATTQLNERFADMRRQDVVNRYLLSEICMCSLVRDVCRSITEELDFNLDFLQ